MEASTPVYHPSPLDKGLQQGEIVTDLIQLRLRLDTLGMATPLVAPEKHPIAVLLTQACDLQQDHHFRQAGIENDKILSGLLFCEVFTAEELFGRLNRDRGLWKRIPQNKDDRYHFLQAVSGVFDAVGTGLPEMGIDFKHCFTVPAAEVYQRISIGEAKRRCVLSTPYELHLNNRFASYLSRVGLPSDHRSE